jgi:hypothetical protein
VADELALAADDAVLDEGRNRVGMHGGSMALLAIRYGEAPTTVKCFRCAGQLYD